VSAADYVVPRAGTSKAWWGMAMFVASESALFAMMIGTYFYLRFKNVQWPPHGIPEPKVVVPLVLLAVLLATSAPMQLALLSGRAGRLGRTRLLLLLALVVQAGYFAMQVHEYASDLSQFQLSENAYTSIYYTLLGADHAHVAIGILFNLWLIAKLVRGFTAYRLRALTAIAFYWHAVNVITLVVTLTILSAAL
jgi:heme/copper-type cytochrome/quinol oxidase subunit 3